MSDVKGRSKFDFNQAVAQAFLTDGGKSFGLRLWFWLSAFYAIVNLIAFPMLAKYYPAMLDLNWQNMQATQAGEVPSTEQSMEIFRLFGKMLPAYLIMLVGMVAAVVVTETALHRRNFFGSEHPRFPVRFGYLELKVLLAQLGVAGMITIIYIASTFVFVTVTTLSALIAAGLAVFITVIGVFAMFWVLVYWMIRLAPAAAMTVEKNACTVLGALPVAKGRTGNLFVAYLVVGIGGYIAVYLVMGIASILLVGGTDFVTATMGFSDEAPSAAFSEMGDKMKNPLFVLIAVISIIAYSAAQALMSLSLSGIASYALKWYRKDNPV